MSAVEKGCVHVYTGDGKGKSTAAFGLALRAAGAGIKVFIAQFAKGRTCSEHKAFEKLSSVSCVITIFLTWHETSLGRL